MARISAAASVAESAERLKTFFWQCAQKCTPGPSTACRAGYVCAPASTEASNTASHAFCDMADLPDAGTD